MKDKRMILLSSLLAASIALNIWQYSKINSLYASAAALQQEVNNLRAESDAKNKEIAEKDEEIKKLSASIEEMKTENGFLKAAIAGAAEKDAQIEELKATIEQLKAEAQKTAKKPQQQPSQAQQPSDGGDNQAQQPSGSDGGGDDGGVPWGSGAFTDMGFGVWQGEWKEAPSGGFEVVP